MSWPTFMPVSSGMGLAMPTVVPGGIVDSIYATNMKIT
jgi:hypothetical protein